MTGSIRNGRRYEEPKLNKWLTTTVETYVNEYGKTDKPVIYEVGSRDGNDGVELAERIYDGNNLWQDSNIVLFDCNPPHIDAIRRSYPQATLVPYAIAEKNGEAEFVQLHGDKNVAGSSSLDKNRVNLPWGKDNAIIQVYTRRLDTIIKDLNHQKAEIDVMKIDIEGYTWEALQSLGKYLRNVKVFHLETEIEGVARYKTNLDVALFMQEKGYICTALDHEWGDTIQDQVWLRR